MHDSTAGVENRVEVDQTRVLADESVMMGAQSPEFQETQWLIRNPWFAWLPAMFFVMYTSGFMALWLRGASTSTDLVMWVMTGLVLPSVLCTWRLKTEVAEGELRVSMPPVWGLGWRVNTSKVAQLSPLRYEFFKEFGAFGVRRVTDQGWVWSAHGTEAVRVKIEGGADRVIGTQRADELIAALQGSEAAAEAASEHDEKVAA